MNQNIMNVLKYICAFTFCVTAASPVSFINKCKADDSKCIRQSTQEAIPIFAAGIPELGVKVLDPLYFKRIDGSTANLKLILNDVYLKGLKKCTVKDVELQNLQSETKKLKIEVICSVEMDAQYEMKGQLLVPIEGKGKANAVISDTTFKVDCLLHDKSGNDGKKYLNVKSCGHSYKFTPNAKVHFDNLFPDNEILAQAAREVIESNPDVIVSELGPPIVKNVIEAIVKDIGNFAENVPLEELVIGD